MYFADLAQCRAGLFLIVVVGMSGLCLCIAALLQFIEVFNNERPHEALDMKCAAEVSQPSPRVYQGLPTFIFFLCPRHIRPHRVTCDRYKASPMSPGRTFGIWWTRGDSNPRPPRCEQ
jgi:hypothetical protein